MKTILMTCAAALLLAAPAFAADPAAPASAPAPAAAAPAKESATPPAAAPVTEAKTEKTAHHGMFDESDTNHDGKVTKDEFMAQQEIFFAKVDKNNDGVITEDEIKAYREDMRAKYKAWREEHQKDNAPAAAAPAATTDKK